MKILRIKRGISLFLTLAIMLAMPVPALAQEQGTLTETLTVHFIDVGQGLAVLAQTGEETLLYDGGSQGASDDLVAYLQENDVEEIDYMISSHYDSDHLGGLVAVLDIFDVGTVLGSDYVHDTVLYETFFDALESSGLSMEYPEPGDEYAFGEGSFTVLAPAEITEDSNENSVVIRLDFGNTSFLLTGDAEAGSEADMIASGLELECNVLVAGHHGSATSSSWDFVEATLPEYVVISCGADNEYGHPHEETIEKFESIEAQIFRTDEQGTVTAVSDGETIVWSTVPSNPYTMYATAVLNIREQPNTDCAVLGRYNAGDAVEAVADSDGWTTVIYGDGIAYVSSAYLSDSIPAQDAAAAQTQAVYETEAPAAAVQTEAPAEPVGLMVWLSATGSKYHRINNCGNMNPSKARQVTEADAIAQGYGKCKNCW